MTLALTHSVALLGLEGHLVTVEIDQLGFQRVDLALI